jgi:hypothetical protein
MTGSILKASRFGAGRDAGEFPASQHHTTSTNGKIQFAGKDMVIEVENWKRYNVAEEDTPHCNCRIF